MSIRSLVALCVALVLVLVSTRASAQDLHQAAKDLTSSNKEQVAAAVYAIAKSSDPAALALLEVDAHKPFECVGEGRESRAAMAALAARAEWAEDALVARFAHEIRPQLDAAELDLAAQLVPQGTAGDLAQRLSATLEILGERGALLQMAQAARVIAKPDAARRVAQLVLEQVE